MQQIFCRNTYTCKQPLSQKIQADVFISNYIHTDTVIIINSHYESKNHFNNIRAHDRYNLMCSLIDNIINRRQNNIINS